VDARVGDGGEEHLRVGVARVLQHVLRPSLFDDLPRVQR
jgi:hypothetical protein